ncbi:M17 family metallopeptidase [Kineosporia sp. A_224]|uniref:leucyl aminopeptidase family protein n=1 Tax=Kineosporia sp. A_224 TaxID=1962180 RepID=UPI000B4BAC50|nr:M17 family peptidase N-terminal domain-containing protein [Kineosporia sp. A_224]
MASVRTVPTNRTTRGRAVPPVRRPPVTVVAGEPLGAGTDLDRVDVLAVTVARPKGSDAPRPDSAARAAAARYAVDLDAVLTGEKVSGRAGEVVRVPVLRDGLPRRLVLLGTGAGEPADLRRAGAALGRSTRGRARLVTSLGAGSGEAGTRAVVEGLLLGAYTAPATGTRSRDDAAPVGHVVLAGRHRDDALARGLEHAAATWAVRDLAVTPSNVKNPQWVVDRALEAAADTGLVAEVWDEHGLEAEGFGGIVTVGRGSSTPPRFVRLDHVPDDVPAGRGARGPVVLVGKGITFDTGGLSIKPREGMVPMKTDMTGAAVVLATLAACRALGVRRHVVGLLALAENAVGASSYRPSDVVRHYGGRTVEVANTDAEGRMVLADALAYADAVLDPDVLVDVATLTGAATLGLGKRHAALYATDERLAAGLEAAAAASGERVWRMPLVEDYMPALHSQVADLRHVSADGKIGGGSITAALFLREFAGGRRWAHLDIAGVARSDRDEHEVCKGATGWGARVLLRWLESLR